MPKNRLLAALSADVQNRLIPSLKLVTLPVGTILHEPDDRITQVYFPNDAIVSLYNPLQSGASAESAVIGCDGIVGIAVLMGGSRTGRAVVHIAGTAYQLPASVLKTEFGRNGEFLALAMRYLQSLMTQTAQTAACNRHHVVDQQLCRWLLLMLDRLPGNELKLTHEMIASMLGVRREGVTEAAGRLQHLKAIEYRRGHITITQRQVLESRSCECYRVVKRESDRLLAQYTPYSAVDDG